MDITNRRSGMWKSRESEVGGMRLGVFNTYNGVHSERMHGVIKGHK